LNRPELESTHPSPQPSPGPRGKDARFLPGTVLDRRYRIVTPLGRGGMGEVYRADDLKLGQPVALKFLPRAFEQDPNRLALLLDEIKLARQVSHPNVCRVWDAGESDGLPFVTMEYVDGEDLSAVLRRIGRLPEERAVQVAGEICAGLSAIHEQGVLHRDLKPSNLMLDGRGRVRITDFGLATLATSEVRDVHSGTPAYMAPEQLEGREVTVRSDIYALGLVLYELFTGRHAFASGRDPSTPVSAERPEAPSSHLRGLDPSIERAIMRCLEPDPAARPASAGAVARALPGGDLLEAARVAGETPSPEMVAAAGGVGGMRVLAALGCVAFVVLGLAGVLALSERRGLPFGADDKPFVALRDRATDFARGLGYAGAGDAVLDGVSRLPGSAGRSKNDVFYWYRRSPYAIFPVIDEHIKPFDFNLPVLADPGALALRLDLEGRLLEFRRIPGGARAGSDTADWGPFFAAARLDRVPSSPVTPRALPPVPTDTRRAWVVHDSARQDTVEAASFGGSPTFFAVGKPYVPTRVRPSWLIANTLGNLLIFALFVLSVWFARRNLKAGRADVKGAVRLSLAMGAIGLFADDWFAQAHIALGNVFVVNLMVEVFTVTFFAASYLALEPIVRRRNPEWLTSWTRLLAGRWLDPLVGRDLLIGTAAGVAIGLASGILGNLGRLPLNGDFQAVVLGGPVALALVMRGLSSAVLVSMSFALFLVLIQLAVRRDWLAWVLWWPFTMLFLYGTSDLHAWPAQVLNAIVLIGWGVTLWRSGLLGAVAALTILTVVDDEFLTTHLGAWYAGVTIVVLATVGVLLAWGWAAVMRGRRAVAVRAMS
jgi:serine/threonine-protein kinase